MIFYTSFSSDRTIQLTEYIEPKLIETQTNLSLNQVPNLPRLGNGIWSRNDNDFFMLNLNQKISKLIMENNEEIEFPNNIAIENAIQAASLLRKGFINLQSLKISVEGGIYSSFELSKQFILHCEFYNDGDIAYILEDKQLSKIIKNDDFKNVNNFIDAIIE